MQKSVIIFITFYLIAIGCSKKSDEQIIIAEVGEYRISLAAFARSYINEIKFSSVQVQDSPSLRMKHLNDMITRHFLAQKAKEANLDTLPVFKKAMASESTAVIINGLYEEEIATQLGEISDEKVRDAYKKLGRKLHIRHLISRTKSGIDSLYYRLQRGESFEILAKECFRDSSLKYNGGDLGYISWGDLDIDLENKAYELQIGEISKPFETKYRWHIIKLENILVNPILRENEYQARKEIIRERLRHRLLKNRADLRIKQLMESKHIRMNIPLIIALQKEQHKLKDNGIVRDADLIEIPDQSFTNILDQYKNENLATYDGGNWTVENFRDYLYTISPNEIEAGIYRAVAMSLRNHFLLNIAKEKKVYKFESVRNKINEKKEQLLSAFYLQAYADTSSFTENDYIEYYQQVKKGRFSNKEMKVLEILVNSELKAREILDILLEKNKDEKVFRQMARQYTIRPGMKEKEGFLGIIRKEDLGDIGKYSYSMNIGDIAGPIKSEAGYSIVMVIDYKQIFIPFSDVKDEIMIVMQRMKKTFTFQKMKHKYTSQADILIHEDVLFDAF